MKFRSLRSLIFAAMTCAAVLVGATTVVNGSTLQNGLDALTYADMSGTLDADFYDVNDDQVVRDEVWATTATGASISRLIFEFAGFANANSFGLYDIFDPSNTLEVFDGSDSAGALAVTFDGAGNTFSTVGLLPTVEFVGSATFTSRLFGYYLSGPGGTFYSQSALNPGEADQMVAYQGRGDIYVNASGNGPGLFASNEYILAWEDLPITGSDRDFTDFVVMVESVTNVPAPAPLALIGIALAGLGFARRRA